MQVKSTQVGVLGGVHRCLCKSMSNSPVLSKTVKVVLTRYGRILLSDGERPSCLYCSGNQNTANFIFRRFTHTKISLEIS